MGALNVALPGIGNARWIAGVQYHHSLLFGNSLLPPGEQLALRVFLEEDVHSTRDYAPVRHLALGIQSTDFFPERPRPLWRRMRKVARIIIRQRRLPQWPRSNLPALVRAHAAQVVFTASGLERAIDLPQVCWIPDFQHLNHPEFFSVEELARRNAAFADIFARARRIVVSNQCGFEDAIRHFPQARERVTVLPFVMFLGHEWRDGDPQRVVQAHGLPRKFLLFPAQFWQHKNHPRLFEAVRQLRDAGADDIALVCTGHPDDPRAPGHGPMLRAFVREHRLDHAIRILGLIPREEQVQLMRAAAAIVQPSLFEGWSALVEECRSLGKTVIASDIAMHREQSFADMSFFDPHSVDALVAQIRALWPELQPGPEPVREAAADTAYRERLTGFARRFAVICREAAGAA